MTISLENTLLALLYEHECVVIPGFGGLVTTHRSAVYIPDMHRLLPPLRLLSFNRHLTRNDGLVITALAGHHGLSYAEAALQCEIIIKEVKASFAATGRFEMQGLGLFYLDSTETICFKPLPDLNLLKSAFGLRAITLKPIAARETPIVAMDMGNPRPRTFNWSRLAAIAALPVAVAMGLWQWTGEVPRVKFMTSMNPFVSAGQVPVYGPRLHTPELAFPGPDTDNFTSSMDNAGPDGLTEFDFTDSGKGATLIRIAAPEPKPVQSDAYYLIAGAFMLESNAARMMATLTAEGVPAFIAGKKGNLHLVAVSAHATKAEAQLAKKTEREKNLWIHRP